MSAIGHFGKGINTRVFDVSLRDHEGNPRHCLGKGVHDGSIKWYSYSSIDANRLSFCGHCAKSGFLPGELREVEDERLKSRLECDSYNLELCQKYGVGDRRSVRKGRMKVNVNIVDADNREFVPVLRSKDFDEAAAEGWFTVPLPSGCYYEIVVMPDESWEYDKDHCFMVKVYSNGKEVRKEDSNGNTNYVQNMSSEVGWSHERVLNQFRIDGYKTGEGNRFFFHAHSKLEKDAGVGGDIQTGKFEIKVSIYKRSWLCRTCGYRCVSEKNKECTECNRPIYRDGRTRGGDSQPKYRGATRGGSSYKAGSSYSAEGYSSGIGKTVTEQARYEVVNTINFGVQLVNRESEEQLEYISRMIQGQVDDYSKDEADRLREEAAALERGSFRSKLFSGNSNLSMEQASCRFAIE